MIYIFGHQGIEQQVPGKDITLLGEMYLILFCQSGLLPFLHGTQASHDVEEIPDSGTTIRSEGKEGILNLKTVPVDRIYPAPDAPETVVVGLEKQGTAWIDRTDPCHQRLIAADEFLLGKILPDCVVDADCKYHEVGLEEGEFLLEQRADFLEVVRDADRKESLLR